LIDFARKNRKNNKLNNRNRRFSFGENANKSKDLQYENRVDQLNQKDKKKSMEEIINDEVDPIENFMEARRFSNRRQPISNYHQNANSNISHDDNTNRRQFISNYLQNVNPNLSHDDDDEFDEDDDDINNIINR